MRRSVVSRFRSRSRPTPARTLADALAHDHCMHDVASALGATTTTSESAGASTSLRNLQSIWSGPYGSSCASGESRCAAPRSQPQVLTVGSGPEIT